MARKPTGAYSVAMVAERWGTSDTFVYDQIKSGRLRAFKLGAKLIRITPEAVEAYEAASVLAIEVDAAPAPDPLVPDRDAARLMRRMHSTT